MANLNDDPKDNGHYMDNASNVLSQLQTLAKTYSVQAKEDKPIINAKKYLVNETKDFQHFKTHQKEFRL